VNPRLVILAAGASERLGQCKALARIGDTTPLDALLSAGAALVDARPLVISGADHAAIAAAAPASCEVAFNSSWQTGRTGGVALARELRADCDLCLAPVDVPLVPREVFAALAQAWLAAGSPPRGWLAPRVLENGNLRHGHPVIVGRELVRELDPQAPLRELRWRATPLFDVDVASVRILDDLDTPADLERLRRLFRA
jgi:CTP:molybdopterin cytidylyltransferase MocA